MMMRIRGGIFQPQASEMFRLNGTNKQWEKHGKIIGRYGKIMGGHAKRKIHGKIMGGL
jgi:hypothetical protein